MSDRDRNDQQQASDAPEQKDIPLDDLTQTEVSKEQASDTKGGGMNYADWSDSDGV